MTDPTARFRPATRRWIAIISFGLVILCAYSAYDAWARNWLKVAIGAGGAAFFLYLYRRMVATRSPAVKRRRQVALTTGLTRLRAHRLRGLWSRLARTG